MITLYNDDCIDVLKSMEDNTVTSIVTDPPYGLKFMGKKWDYDVPSVEVWKECLRVLKPGGTLLCFAGTRTQHRMAVNIEDAGFVLKDTLLYCFGVGFPKAADIAKNIDKKLGNEREVVGETVSGKILRANGQNERPYQQGKDRIVTNLTKGNTEWEGYKSHGLKPAYEPILLAMKPNDGSYADNALKHGVAGLNVDGSRVEYKGDVKHTKRKSDGVSNHENPSGWKEVNRTANRPSTPTEKGRFPANLIHDGSENVVECFPETKSGKGVSNTYDKNGGYKTLYSGGGKQIRNADFGDSGSAARYFKTCPILDEDIETQRIFYTAKASKKERNEGLEGIRCVHPTVKPIKLLDYLVGLIKMPENTVVLDPFMGSGTTGIACVNNDVDFIGIELEPEYFDIAKARIEYAKSKIEVNDR